MSGFSLPPPCPPSGARSQSEKESARSVLVPSKMEQNGNLTLPAPDAPLKVDGVDAIKENAFYSSAPDTQEASGVADTQEAAGATKLDNGRFASALDARAQCWNADGDVDALGAADALGAVEGIISGGTTPTKPPRPRLSCSAAESPHHTPRDGRDVETQRGNWIESEFVHLEGQVSARAWVGGMARVCGNICCLDFCPLWWTETHMRGYSRISTAYT